MTLASVNGAGPAPAHPRGEVAIRLGGETLSLRPTFECMAEIEAALGEGLLPLATRVVGGGLGFRDAAAIVAAGSRAAGRPLDQRWLRQTLLDTGLVALAGPLARFLFGAVAGSADAPAEEGAAQPAGAARPTTGAGSAN